MKHSKLSTVLLVLIFLIISTLCVYLSAPLSDGTASIIKDSFILLFLGLIAGIIIVCITIIYSNIEKIRNNIHMPNTNSNQSDTFLERHIKGFKQDIVSSSFSLIICFVVILIRDINLNASASYFSFITQQQIVSIIEIELIFMSLKAIFDMMLRLIGLFEISTFASTNRAN